MDSATKRITFETDIDDRHQAIQAINDRESVRDMVRQIRKKSVIVGASFMCLLILGSAWLLTMLNIPLESPLYGVILATVLIWGFMWGYRNFALSGIAQRLEELYTHMARTRCGPGIDGEGYVEIGDESLRMGDRHIQAEYRWPCFYRIERCMTCAVFELIDGRHLIIPMRAFEYKMEPYKSFIDELEQRNHDAGGWDGIVAEYLCDYKLACPKCRYELFQTKRALCPECGKPITPDDFRQDLVTKLPRSEPVEF